jgi:hypothetical protein
LIKFGWCRLPFCASSTFSNAAVAFAVFAVLEENATMAAETSPSSERRACAEPTASFVDRVVIGTTEPSEFVVPVIIVVVGPEPLGSSMVLVTVVIVGTGQGKTVGNGDDEEVTGGSVLELGGTGAGGAVGNGKGGNPGRDVVVAVGTGSHAMPPGPTTNVVGSPSTSVVIVLNVVNDVNWVRVVGVKVISVLEEPSVAVHVMTALDSRREGKADEEPGRPDVGLGNVEAPPTVDGPGPPPVAPASVGAGVGLVDGTRLVRVPADGSPVDDASCVVCGITVTVRSSTTILVHRDAGPVQTVFVPITTNAGAKVTDTPLPSTMVVGVGPMIYVVPSMTKSKS